MFLLKVALCAMLVFAAPAFAQVQPTVDLQVSPEVGVGSTDVTLTWTSTGAVACTAGGAWSGPKATSGSETILGITTKRTYNLSCRAATGPLAVLWTASVLHVDGTPGVATSYRLFEASSAGGVPSATPVSVPGTVLSYVLWLPSGLHYVGIKAVEANGFTSAMSNIVSLYVYALAASDSVQFNVVSRLQSPVLQLATN